MRGLFVVALCLWSVVAYWGGLAAWERTVQEFPSGARFSQPLRVKGLERVLWGEPTLVGKTRISADEFEALIEFLAATHGERFFVAGEATLLYGLLGVPSPGPLLWFVEGYSYLSEDIPEMKRRLHESLKQLKVRYVVVEKSTFMSTKRNLRDFGITEEWLQREFHLVRDFGHFQIYMLVGT